MSYFYVTSDKVHLMISFLQSNICEGKNKIDKHGKKVNQRRFSTAQWWYNLIYKIVSVNSNSILDCFVYITCQNYNSVQSRNNNTAEMFDK